MSTQLAVDKEHSLVEVESPPRSKYPAGLRVAARIISYLFHPLFIPVYLVWVMVYIQPYLFSSFDKWGKTVVIIQAIVWYTFFPLVIVLLLKGLNFIDSIFLKTRKDRIAPYIATMVVYWWGWHVRNNLPDSPPELVIFTFAVFLACVAGFLANIYIKISMHAIAAGVMAAFIMRQGFIQDISFGIFISISLLLTGLICTARFIESNHEPKEIYGGVALGVVSLVVAIYFA